MFVIVEITACVSSDLTTSTYLNRRPFGTAVMSSASRGPNVDNRYGWPNVTQLWSSDIEFLDFDSVEASPPSTLSELEPLHLGLVEKMKERRQAVCRPTMKRFELS